MTSSQAEQVLRRSHRSRPNKSKLLEAAAADLVEQIKTLAKQNALLRAKEAMQFEILKNYEDSLHHMGQLLCGLAEGPDSNNEAYEGAILSAAMLDFRAVELLQQLCTSSGTHHSTSNSGHAGSSPTTSGAQLTAFTQQEQSCGTSQGGAEGQTRTGSPAGQSCTGSDKNADASTGQQKAASLERRTARMWQSVTSEAVVAMQGASVQSIAERIKAAAARIALMSRCTSQAGMAAAVEEYGVVVMLAMVAADASFLEVTCLNLETMQPDSPPENLWESVTRTAGLSAAQRLQIYLAFECYRDQRTTLLQEQASTVKQLQALLGGPPSPAEGDVAAAQQQAHAAAGSAAAMQQQQRQVQRAGRAGSNAGAVVAGSAAAAAAGGGGGPLVPFAAGNAAPMSAPMSAQGVPASNCLQAHRGAISSFTSLLLGHGDGDAVLDAPQAAPTPQQQQQPRGMCAPRAGSNSLATATATGMGSLAGGHGINASSSGSRQRPPQCPQPGSAKSTANTASRAAGAMITHPTNTSSRTAGGMISHGTTTTKINTGSSSRTHSSRSRSSSSSSDVSRQVMTLDLEAAEQAEVLLCQLARNIRLQREYSRRLVYLWMDLLSEEQHAEGILAAYPFLIKTPAVCAYIWQQEADKRKGSPIRKP